MFGTFAPRLRALVANAAYRIFGGGANQVLYQDANQNLGSSQYFKFDGTNLSCPGTGSFSEHFGANSSTASNFSVVIGNSASTSQGVAIGYGANAGGTDAIAIGYSSTASGTAAIAIGRSNAAPNPGSIVIAGYNRSAAAKQFAIGSSNYPIIDVAPHGDTTGVSYTAYGLSSTSVEEKLGSLSFSFATSTDASWKGRVIIYATDFTSGGTNREGLRIESDGTQPLLGVLGHAAAAKAATPATVGDVITILQNFGFCS